MNAQTASPVVTINKGVIVDYLKVGHSGPVLLDTDIAPRKIPLIGELLEVEELENDDGNILCIHKVTVQAIRYNPDTQRVSILCEDALK